MKKGLEIIQKAYNEGYAIPQFNINNLEWTKYILEESNRLKSPVILGVSKSAAQHMGGYMVVRTLVNGLIHSLNITIPVILHLDHGQTYEDCKEAKEAGFESLMIDGSKLSLTDNINITKQICNDFGTAIIEGETGLVDQNSYTSLNDAKYYVEKTYVDIYAPAIGNKHGLYVGEPHIDFELLKSMKELNKPLVLHGASLLSDEILKECIKNGVAKINFNTELQIAWANSIKEYLTNNPDEYDPRKIISSGETALKKVVENKINVLESYNKEKL